MIEETKKEPAAEPEAGRPKPTGLKGLEDLHIEDINKAASAVPPRRRRGRPPARKKVPAGPSPDDVKKDMEELADMILGMNDNFLVQNGLTPVNPAQRLIIKAGFVGTMLKYNLSVDEYPEFMLLGGVVWAGMDKYNELKALPPKQKKGPDDKNDNRKEGIRKDNVSEAIRPVPS